MKGNKSNDGLRAHRWEIPEANPRYNKAQGQENAGKIVLQDMEVWTKQVFDVVPTQMFVALRKNTSHLRTVTNYLCYSNILVMPVPRSPWRAAKMSVDGCVKPYDNSYQTLEHLQFLRMFVRECSFKDGTDQAILVAGLSSRLDAELNTEIARLKARLEKEVYVPQKDNKCNETNWVFKFIKILEKFTIKFINLVEVFLWEALINSRDIDLPLEACLTPLHTPNARVLVVGDDKSDWKKLIKAQQQYFKLRNALYLAATNRKGKNIDYFCWEKMPEYIFNAVRQENANEIYNSYLLFGTAKAYCDMLNTTFK